MGWGKLLSSQLITEAMQACVFMFMLLGGYCLCNYCKLLRASSGPSLSNWESNILSPLQLSWKCPLRWLERQRESQQREILSDGGQPRCLSVCAFPGRTTSVTLFPSPVWTVIHFCFLRAVKLFPEVHRLVLVADTSPSSITVKGTVVCLCCEAEFCSHWRDHMDWGLAWEWGGA